MKRASMFSAKQETLPALPGSSSKPIRTVSTVSNEESQEEETYDPYRNREVAHPTTNIETFSHLVKAFIGTGLLAMPFAFQKAGLIIGVLGVILTGAICTYGMHIMLRCQYLLCKKNKVPILTYPATVKLALEQGPRCLKSLSPFAETGVNILLIVYQLGICSIYVVFVAKCIKEITDYYWYALDVRLWMVIFLVPFTLLLLIRDLKLLAPFTQVANFFIFIGIGIILFFIFKHFPSKSTYRYIGTLGGMPVFYGTVLFAVEPIGVIGAIESQMKHPEDFGGYFGLLNLSAVLVISLYTFFGSLGYVKFGEDVKESISLNIPREHKLSVFVDGTYAAAIYVSYGLQLYVPLQIVWSSWVEHRVHPKQQLKAEYITRFLLVLITFAFAVAIPKLGLFISLVGGMCLPLLGLGLPGIIDFCIHWPDRSYGLLKYVLWRNIFLVVVSICSTLIVMGVTIAAIIQN